MEQLSHTLKSGHCDATSNQHHLERLQSTATDIVPVFDIAEQPFTDAAGQLQTRVQQALQAVLQLLQNLSTYHSHCSDR